MYSLQYIFTCYLAVTYKTFNLIDFKSEIDGIFVTAILPFFHSLPVYQLSPHKLNNGSHSMVEPVILLPVTF